MALQKTLRQVIDDASPGSLAEAARTLKLGKLLRAMPTFLRHQKPVLDAAIASTCDSIVLPNDAKASTIIRATARAGTATVGEMIVDAFGTPPTTTLHIGVAANGDISVLAADAWTDMDVEYQPTYGDVVVLSLPVASNAMVIPAALIARGVVYLIDANATAGTTLGRKIIQIQSASAASTGSARLDLAKANVKFGSADAVTAATVTLLVAAADDFNATLESTSTGVM